jgi:glycoside/pentoside/hexuronide:cation symporter, GPH family
MNHVLKTKDKIFFAVGGMGENIAFQAATAWIFFFWSGAGDPNKALVPIGLLGILIGIGRLIEAFDDPLIGHLSDRTRSRWGRRFPYIFAGSPFLALSFIFLWSPVQGSAIFNAAYFFIALQFFFFTYTLVSAPYEGILPELAKTSHDRVSTSAWRVFFGVIGAAIGLVGSSILIQNFGFKTMGVILGLATLATFWISIFGIRKRLLGSQRQTLQKSLTLSKALLSTLKNKQFLIFSFAFVLFSLGFNLLNALLPFFVKFILNQQEGTVAIFSGLVLSSMILALPIQTKLSRKFGKKKIYSYSMLALSLIFPLLFLVGIIPFSSTFWQAAFVTVLIGLALSGQFIFPNAILADVIDYDETKTHQRREAIYYGMQNTLQKFSFAISSILFGVTLSVFGATAENQLGIRLIGPIAGIATFLGFIIFVKWYKLPDVIKHAKLKNI